MAESDICKTAIINPFGLWEYLRMPFGLKNGAQTFQQLMDTILRGIPCILIYLDDILVSSSTRTEHADHLRQFFQSFVSQWHGGPKTKVSSVSLRSTSSATMLPYLALNHYQNMSQQFVNSLVPNTKKKSPDVPWNG